MPPADSSGASPWASGHPDCAAHAGCRNKQCNPQLSYQLLMACEPPAIVPFPFQDAPESHRWPVVNTFTHSGHALLHICGFQLVAEPAVRALETSIAVKQRMRIRIRGDSSIRSIEYQWIIIAISDNVGHDSPAVQLEDGTQIYFVSL